MSIPTLISILIGPVLAITIIVILMKTLGGRQKENQRILQTGMPARARVLQLQHTGTSVSFGAHRHLNLIIAMEVHIQGRPPYAISSEQLISELTLPSIQPGAWLEVRVDPQNPEKIAIAGGGNPGAYGHPGAMPMGMSGQPGLAGIPGMAATPGGWVAPNTGATMNKAFKRAIIMTGVISVIVMVPLLAVFVDWSAFGLGGDDGAPEGGYCKALVRCCKIVHGDAGTCDNYADLPGAGCKSAYETYQKSAKATGKSCE